jgi:phosphoribosylformimino-5-aminoimidazole carboxamide ribotide isomerase
MRVIPAVDIKDGKAVRLVQGRADRETVYDQDPVHAARRWAEGGARRVHVVDLDGAFQGLPRNTALILEIIHAFPKTEIEVGGGLRTEEAVRTLVEAGAARCVIGTRAAEDHAFLAKVAQAFPGKVSVGVDAKNGKVVTKGWVEVRDLTATDMVKDLAGLPLGEVIYTDIERDGMLEGPSFLRLQEIRAVSPFPVIASGGVTTVEQLRRLREMGCYGAIVGKALFDGRMDLAAALAEDR